MSNGLLGANGDVIPANANDAFAGQIPTNAQLDSDLADFTNDTTLDADSNGFLDAGLQVVDWVLVQARVVADGAPVPNTVGFCNDNPCPIKAALLMQDGRISELDDEGALGGIVTFEDLAVEENQVLYVAVFHRNHVPVLSTQDAGAEDEEGVIAYNLDESSNIANAGAAKAIGGAAGKVALRGGNSDANATINALDYREVATNLGRGRLYSTANQDFNGVINALDYRVAAGNLGRGEFFQFFATP